MSEQAPAPAEAGSKGPSPIILAAAVLLLSLGGAFAIVYFLLPGKIAAAIAANAPAAAPTAPAAAEGAKPAEGGKPGEGGATGGDSFILPDILVNISGTHAGRFLKVTVYFDAKADVIAELQAKKAQITDIVSATLGQKSLDELTDPGVRGRLRAELMATINPLLDTKGQIDNIYFPEFIIQ